MFKNRGKVKTLALLSGGLNIPLADKRCWFQRLMAFVNLR